MDKKIRKEVKDTLKKIDIDMFNLGMNEVEEFDYYKTGFDNVDWILGGGLPMGDWVEIYGEEGSGKTTFALQVVGNILRAHKDKVALYVDVENALDINWVRKHVGEAIDRVEIIQPEYLESMSDAIRIVVEKGYVDIIVIDTLMAAVPKKIYFDDSSQIGVRAVAEQRMIQNLNPLVKRAKVPVIVLNQMRLKNLGGNRFMFDVAGGMAKRYFMNEKIYFHKPKKTGKDADYILEIETKKNKHKAPFLSASLYFKTGEGFDGLHSYVEAKILSGEVDGKGAWLYYKGEKYNGKEALKTALEAEYMELIKGVKKGQDKQEG